jgi:hypothetical protein
MSNATPIRVSPAAAADLAGALVRLTEEGGDGNRLVLEQGPAWIAFEGQRDAGYVRCVAAARKQLPADAAIGLDQVLILRSAGFANSAGGPGLARGFELRAGDPPDATAALCLDLLARVYGRPGAEAVTLELRLRDRDRTENPPLVEAMLASAKTKDGAARQAVYRAMLRASFLVPMQGDAPRVVGDLSGWDCYAGFTDARSLERWAGRPVDYRIIKGRALFPLLARLRTGSLLVNPGGAVGGELYRNEVEAIANAVR